MPSLFLRRHKALLDSGVTLKEVNVNKNGFLRTTVEQSTTSDDVSLRETRVEDIFDGGCDYT